MTDLSAAVESDVCHDGHLRALFLNAMLCV